MYPIRRPVPTQLQLRDTRTRYTDEVEPRFVAVMEEKREVEVS